MNYLKLKASLLVDGIRAEKSALAGLGETYKVSVVSDILQSIRDNTGLERIPGTVLPSPAKGDDIQRYYDTGIQSLGYSMEIWDDRLYQAICPGKSESTSHDEFVRSIEKAVDVFGPGNVYGVLVMGLETKEKFL